MVEYQEIRQHLRTQEQSVEYSKRKSHKIENNEFLRDKASVDELTGLKTFSYLKHVYEIVRPRIERGKDITILYMDIDNFKSINDKNSHAEGDKLLKHTGSMINGLLGRVSEIIKEQIRENRKTVEGEKFVRDVAVRYCCGGAGDEFVIALYGTPERGGKVLGDRLVNCAREDQLFKKHSATLTIGVASKNGCAQLERIISRAEQATQHGKNNGKNGCYVFSEIFGELVIA